MSTRCQVILKDKYDELWFYRHSDGYPEGVTPTLDKFCQWIKEGRIRDNVEQAAGWLVVIGRDEYKCWEKRSYEKAASQAGYFEPGPGEDGMGWQVGAYEPCAKVLHGDIEFLYVVDLTAASWCQASAFDRPGNTYCVN